MKKTTAVVLTITLLVLISSLVCARGTDSVSVENIPTNQGQNIPTAQTTQTQNELPESISGLGPMNKITVSQAESRNAVCNDGTPAVYFIRRGIEEGSTRWIIHLQGGGFCYNSETCNRRGGQESELMTTGRTPRSRPGNGILSSSNGDNKFFASVNQVFVAYCSSDLWSGDRAASPETNGLHFRGASIVRAVIEDLADPSITASPNLAEATDILFSGSSAGGAGVLAHLDWLAEKFPKASVRGIDDAGWFINIPPYNPTLTPVDEVVQSAYKYWNGTVDESCADVNPGTEGLCYLGEQVYPYISAPLFVQIAQFDGPQLISLGLKLPIDDAETEYANQFAAAVRASLESVMAAFSPADRTHGLLTNENFLSVRIDNLSLQDVLGRWIFNLDGPVKVIDQP